jgi:hypothetical protein
MAVVEAILESRGMDWDHVTRSVAYFKRQGNLEILGRFLAQHGLPKMPMLHVVNDVCRDDLLFEIEVDAIRA